MEATTNVSLRALLDEMIKRGASDLHLTVGERPKLRVDGQLVDTSFLIENDAKTGVRASWGADCSSNAVTSTGSMWMRNLNCRANSSSSPSDSG